MTNDITKRARQRRARVTAARVTARVVADALALQMPDDIERATRVRLTVLDDNGKIWEYEARIDEVSRGEPCDA